MNGQLKDHHIIVPQKKNEGYLFLPWDGREINLSGYVNAVKPIKDVFFPQWESLIKYRIDKESIVEVSSEIIEHKPLIIFGTRPCDAKSIMLLDCVFNGKKFKDPYYCSRRENTLIISLACTEPASTCFCYELNMSPMTGEGSDILLVDMDDQYLAFTVTEKGKEIISKEPFQKASIKNKESFGNVQKTMEEKYPSALKTNFTKEKITDLFSHGIWNELYQKCLNCGVCTFLCPTCHCFDINEDAADTEGRRVRNWDSCMFSNFTIHGSGHNPRPTNKERLRQRFLHKFKYFPDNYQEFACVGCGRCILKCPVNLDIREVLRGLGVLENVE